MINKNYMNIPGDLKTEFKQTFTGLDNNGKFIFLKKYVQFIEDDNNSYHCLFLLDNPLKNKENEEFLDEFNKIIHDFLLDMSNIGSNNKDSKHLRGLGFNYIGVGYEFGIFNFPVKPCKAYTNYKISAKLSSDLGTFRLAQCYERGCGTSVCYTQSLCFYRCAAKLGLVDAMHAYGIVLINGYLDADVDIKTGLYYLQNAANNADTLCPYPLFDLGLLYENTEDDNLPQDSSFALDMFKKGADFGDTNCLFRLAQVYEFGQLGCTRDSEKSYSYYEMAAGGGHIEALLYMSTHSTNGTSRILNLRYEDCFLWALRAALKGHAQAAFRCAKSAETGVGVEKDQLFALWLYKIAENMGISDATEKIEEIEGEVKKRTWVLMCPKVVFVSPVFTKNKNN